MLAEPPSPVDPARAPDWAAPPWSPFWGAPVLSPVILESFSACNLAGGSASCLNVKPSAVVGPFQSMAAAPGPRAEPPRPPSFVRHTASHNSSDPPFSFR